MATGKKLDAVIAAINKKNGREVVNRLGKIKDRFVAEFIPTPSLEVNIAMGGGFKRGIISETAGEQSSGKTSFWLEIIALDQKNHKDGTWGWLETEGSFDWDYAVNVHGIDENRLIVTEVEDQGAEASLDILEALVRTGELRGIVINSVAGLTPKREIDGEMGDQNVGLQARMMSKLMRKIVGITAKTKTHVAFINQFREKVGVLHGDPRTTTGGRALAFFAGQRIDFNKVKIEKGDGFSEEEAIKVSFRIRKNRAVYRNPWVKGSFVAIFGEGIDQVGEIARLAPQLGICEKSGSWIYYPTKDAPTTINGTLMKFQSSAGFMEFLEQNDDAREKFYSEVMERLKDGEETLETMSAREVKEVENEEQAAKNFLEENVDDLDKALAELNEAEAQLAADVEEVEAPKKTKKTK